MLQLLIYSLLLATTAATAATGCEINGDGRDQYIDGSNPLFIPIISYGTSTVYTLSISIDPCANFNVCVDETCNTRIDAYTQYNVSRICVEILAIQPMVAVVSSDYRASTQSLLSRVNGGEKEDFEMGAGVSLFLISIAAVCCIGCTCTYRRRYIDSHTLLINEGNSLLA
jgi:hypothetical protein